LASRRGVFVWHAERYEAIQGGLPPSTRLTRLDSDGLGRGGDNVTQATETLLGLFRRYLFGCGLIYVRNDEQRRSAKITVASDPAFA
jgi:hypothetical protein